MSGQRFDRHTSKATRLEEQTPLLGAFRLPPVRPVTRPAGVPRCALAKLVPELPAAPLAVAGSPCGGPGDPASDGFHPQTLPQADRWKRGEGLRGRRCAVAPAPLLRLLHERHVATGFAIRGPGALLRSRESARIQKSLPVPP